jgi:hypothetical protein
LKSLEDRVELVIDELAAVGAKGLIVELDKDRAVGRLFRPRHGQRLGRKADNKKKSKGLENHLTVFGQGRTTFEALPFLLSLLSVHLTLSYVKQ